MWVDRKWLWAAWVAALICAMALSALNLWWGDLNQDEGWYLYAARQVGQGRLPYRDFAFTQGPVMPITYAVFARWIREHGVLAGRLITMALGWLAAALSALLAARLTRPGARAVAALIAFALVGCNVYQSYFTTVVKTYALTAVLLLIGLCSLSFVGGFRGGGAAFLAGIFMGLAAGTRLSAGAVMPVAGSYLLVMHCRVGKLRWLAYGLGGVVGLLLWAGPFAWIAPDGFRFAMLDYHAGRSAGASLAALIYKAGFVSRLVQAYFVGSVLIVALVGLRVLGLRPKDLPLADNAPPCFGALLWWSAAAVTLTHIAAPFPYEDYQVFVWPVVAIALSISSVSWLWSAVVSGREREPSRVPAAWGTWFISLVLLACVASSFASPINQDWFVRGRDRIWWPLKEQSPIRQLKEVAAGLAEFAWLDDELLTQDIYLAVEADMSVPPGMELGPFCYFPDMERARAEKLRVLNRDMLRETLAASGAQVAAFSGYGLAIRAPEITPLSPEEQRELRDLLQQRYQLLCEVPHFGQGHTTLQVYVRRRK